MDGVAQPCSWHRVGARRLIGRIVKEIAGSGADLCRGQQGISCSREADLDRVRTCTAIRICDFYNELAAGADIPGRSTSSAIPGIGGIDGRHGKGNNIAQAV